jgi:membrane-bound lytic murein transglycosylase B
MISNGTPKTISACVVQSVARRVPACLDFVANCGFDGNGKRDLIRSVPDVLASTANYLKGYGWNPGPFGEGSANFEILKEWNKSPVYQKTIATFAARLMGGE